MERANDRPRTMGDTGRGAQPDPVDVVRTEPEPDHVPKGHVPKGRSGTHKEAVEGWHACAIGWLEVALRCVECSERCARKAQNAAAMALAHEVAAVAQDRLYSQRIARELRKLRALRRAGR